MHNFVALKFLRCSERFAKMLKWKPTICLVVLTVGALHGMTHMEFHRLYTQLMDDIDKLVELSCDYFVHAIAKLGFSKNTGNNKVLAITEHYDTMIQRAAPLFNLFKRDFRYLLHTFNSLESIQMVTKFLYAYFRQSAINLIDHMKVVYELQ